MTNVISDNKVKDLGIVKIEESGRIIDFAEKPVEDSAIENFRLTPKIKKLLGIDDPNLNFLASMGNYVFFWNQLKKFLDFPGVDFGKDVIPSIKGINGALYAYVFNGYWRDIGKVQDYFNCNMAFANGKAPIDLSKHRIRTQKALLPSPHIAIDSSINGTILSSGDVIHQGSTVRNSVLGYQVVIEKGCKIEHCVFLGDEKNGVHSAQMNERRYTTQIGKYSSLSHTILHENVWIGEGVDISPYNGTPEERKEILKSVGLVPYTKLNDGTVEGDFYIEPDTGILVIGKQYDADPKKPILPDGLKC
jgi:glucose-1-phosphate adenylyltransferase